MAENRLKTKENDDTYTSNVVEEHVRPRPAGGGRQGHLQF